jgi:hypothetical protein
MPLSSCTVDIPTDLTLRVIQEGLLNQSGAFFWGDQEISLREFSFAVGRLMNWSYLDDSYRQSFLWVSQSPRCFSSEGSYDIFKVLQWVRCRHCLDDRDRVYAVLGLPYHPRYPWNVIIRNIEPDYSQRVGDLHERLACDFVKLGGTLRVLSAVHHGSSLRAWQGGVEPSWIPRWNEYLTSDLEHRNLRGRWTGNELEVRYRLIRPTSIDLHQKSIVVECVRYDSVTLLSDSLLHADGESQNAESMFAFWREALRTRHGARSSRLEFAWTTIKISDCICGTVKYFELIEAELHGALNLLEILRWQYRKQNLGEAEQSANRQLCVMLKAGLRAVQEHNPFLKDGEYAPYERLFHPAERLKYRRLFLTQRKQVGLGPEAMRPGDVVVNLKGSTLPFIVRPQGSFCRFVGAARMPESMRRDAMAQAEQGGAKMELMEIR